MLLFKFLERESGAGLDGTRFRCLYGTNKSRAWTYLDERFTRNRPLPRSQATRLHVMNVENNAAAYVIAEFC